MSIDINNTDFDFFATDTDKQRAVLEDPLVARFRKALTETVDEVSESGAVIKTQRPVEEAQYQLIKSCNMHISCILNIQNRKKLFYQKFREKF